MRARAAIGRIVPTVCLVTSAIGCSRGDAVEIAIARRDTIAAQSWTAAPRLAASRARVICGASFATSCASGWAQGQAVALRDGRLIFSDRREGVLALAPDGRPVATFGGIGTREGEYFHVADVAATDGRGVVILDDRENLLLEFDSSAHLVRTQSIPLATAPGTPWRGDSVVAMAADSHGAWLVTVAPGERMGARQPGRLWLLHMASGVRQVAWIPVRTAKVGRDDMQPPEPLFVQRPLLAPLGRGNVVYLDPSEPGRLLVIDSAGTARELRILADLRRVTAEDLASELRARVRAVLGPDAPNDSATACRDATTINCLAFRHFTKAARLAASVHPFASSVRVSQASTGDPTIWIREGAPETRDSVQWTAVSVSHGVLGYLMLATSDQLAPISDSVVIIGRPGGVAGTTLTRVTLAKAVPPS